MRALERGLLNLIEDISQAFSRSRVYAHHVPVQPFSRRAPPIKVYHGIPLFRGWGGWFPAFQKTHNECCPLASYAQEANLVVCRTSSQSSRFFSLYQLVMDLDWKTAGNSESPVKSQTVSPLTGFVALSYGSLDVSCKSLGFAPLP